MIDDLKSYYQERFRKYQRAPASVQHSSLEGQYRRFEILCAGLASDCSVIDVGCGLGDMLRYLRANGFTGKYLGLDFTPEFIAAAQEDYAQDPDCNFLVFDMLNDRLPDDYHYAVVSGVFNNRMNSLSNSEFLYSSITKMHQAAINGIRFNALSTFVDFYDDELYYENPLEVFQYCRTSLSPYVSLKHDYVFSENGYPYEFTIYVDKQPVDNLRA